jgi:hypothetical protein
MRLKPTPLGLLEGSVASFVLRTISCMTKQKKHNGRYTAPTRKIGTLPLIMMSPVIPRIETPLDFVGFDFCLNQTEDLLNAVGALILFQAGMWNFDGFDTQRGMSCGNFTEDKSFAVKITYKSESGLISAGVPIDSTSTVIMHCESESNAHTTRPSSLPTPNINYEVDLKLMEDMYVLDPKACLRRALEICKLTFDGTFFNVEIDDALTSIIGTQLMRKQDLKFHEAVDLGLDNYRAIFQRSLSRNPTDALPGKSS